MNVVWEYSKYGQKTILEVTRNDTNFPQYSIKSNMVSNQKLLEYLYVHHMA